jgi:hypothetical protein
VAVERLVEQVIPEFGRIDGGLAIYRGGSEARAATGEFVAEGKDASPRIVLLWWNITYA